MIKDIHHGFWNRNSIRAVLCAVAVLAFQVTAQAAKLPQWGTTGVTHNGNSFSINPAGGDLRVPVKNLQGGWQTAGNYGVQNGATPETFNLRFDGQVYKWAEDGKQILYPLEGKGTINKSDVAGALGALLAVGLGGGLPGMVCAIACPAIADFVAGTSLRLAPISGVLEKPSMSGGSYECQYGSITVRGSIPRDCAQEAATKGGWPQPDYEVKNDSPTMNNANWYIATQSGGSLGRVYVSTITEGKMDWIPASMDDIAPYMKGKQPTVGMVPELLRQGADIPLPSAPNVTGPSSIQGNKEVTQNPDGSRTERTTTYNFTTQGNTVTNTTNNTTSTVINNDNSIRSTTTTTSTPSSNVNTNPTTPKEETTDPCKENPDRVACMETDTPEAKIEKQTKNVTFTPQDLPISAGSCPADVSMSFRSAGGIGAQKIVDWRGFCDMAIPLRAIVMALAAIMAFFIVMPGGRVE